MKNNYFRYIAISGGIFFSTILILVFYYVNAQLQNEIAKAGEESNATLTRVFVNETWSEISPLLPPARSDLKIIKDNPNIQKIDSRMRRFMSYTDVLKVKLYNTNGITTYSSDFSQIGEDKTSNIGFQTALKGNLASELTHRGKFGSFDGDLYNRDLVSTYAPIRDGSQIVAVAEIYSDRTNSIHQATILRNELIGFLVGGMVFLYSIFLFASFKIYSRIQSQAERLSGFDLSKNLKVDVKHQARLKTHEQPPITPFPMQELSLFGLGQLIQRISLYGIEELPQKSIDILKSSLPTLSKKAGVILNRIVKYRNLKSQDFSIFKINPTNIDCDELVKFISDYSAEIGGISSIKFFQGHRSSDRFIQNTDAIKLVITSFIDFASFGLPNPKVELKFYGDSDTLGIDLIVESDDVTNLPAKDLFNDLDQHIDVFAQSLSFKYKGTLSHNGLLVSISMRPLKDSGGNLVPQGLEVQIFCPSVLDSELLSALLEKIGLSNISIRNQLDLDSGTTISEKSLIFINPISSHEGYIEFNKLIDQLKRININPNNIFVLTEKLSQSSDLDYSYHILEVPFNDESLKRLFIGQS